MTEPTRSSRYVLDSLIETAVLTGLQRWSGSVVRQRASSPKWIARNTALVTAGSRMGAAKWRGDPARWGGSWRTAIDAHLINHADDAGVEVFYWRDGNHEVDFVLRRGRKVYALEV